MKDLIRKILKEEKNLLATSAETLVRSLPKELKVKSIKTNFNALQPQQVGVPCAALPSVGGLREYGSYRTIAEHTA